MNGHLSTPSTKFSVGLTGGIGSGKTGVANAFASRGASIVDTDVIARQLTAPGGLGIASIEAVFGAGMIATDGAMDRAKMREAVFADPAIRQRLESILHPIIRSEAQNQMDAARGLYTIVVVPLLTEAGQSGHWQFSRVLVVDCDEQIQLQRVMQRDGLGESLVKSIIAQQASRQQRLAIADDILTNQSKFDDLIPEIDRLHRKYCELAGAD